MITAAQARDALRSLLPGVAVAEVVPRTGGENSGVFEIRCDRPPTRLIIKVYPEGLDWKMAKEAHVYGLLAEAGLPVPEVLGTDGSRTVIDGAYTVMTALEGTPLSEAGAAMTGEETHRIYRRLGELLGAVHRLRQDAFGYVVTGVLSPVATNAEYMRERFTQKFREFADLGGDPALLRSAESFVAARDAAFAGCPNAVLCHNDFYEGNILVAHGDGGWRVTGLVDVENALAADPLLDLAKTDFYSMRGAPAKRRGLLEGYGPLPPTWPGAFPLYRLFHALELWDWYASTGEPTPLPHLAEDIRQMTC
ncbi:phosphotransferase family protein [Sphaerisporangium corydalis]|uniref:Phosphotransferase family protein n=1 Tax=Sphaerisporangium corydalis TaxID=1441875 RepID=A0ABV9EDN3_9ACTN|nr:aminoglycoside phosphotransferase family protein [Sphaerisporangium corydalis]